MITTTSFTFFKRAILSTFLLSLTVISFAQVAPYSLPPRWFFGHRTGMDFTGGAPVFMAGNTWDGSNYSNQEGATTECFPNGTVAFYSNSCVMKDGTHTLRGTNPLPGGGNSSTQGCLSIPYPPNPATQFYFVTTDVDNSGGSDCSNPATDRGVYVYLVTTGAFTVAAPTKLLTNAIVNETIAACSDNVGGYWIIAHSNSNTTYYAWHIDYNGVINTTPVTSTGSLTAVNWKYQASIKINKCNNRIAFVTNTGVEVYNWNATTGTLGALIRSHTPGGFMYGCEFSPDGNILYVTDFSGGLYHYNLGTGVWSTVSATSIGTLGGGGTYGNIIIGPDDKIYVSEKYAPAISSAKYIGVINTPNSTTAAGAGYAQGAGSFQLTAGGNYPSTQAGMITLGWHNPNLPITESNSPTCMNFSYTYTQYYGATIAVVPGSQEWDFGEGAGYQTGLGATPIHVYAADGNYTVKLRLRDQLCNNLYENRKSITVACPMPVSWLDFTAEKSGAGVLLNWATAMEINNDYFLVEHSTDGIHFSPIGTVDGSGNSNIIHNYSFTHHTPSSGNNYYRIIQYDFDGQSTTSEVRSVNFTGVLIAVVPNPSQSSFNLNISGTDQAEAIVLDVLGRVVYKSVVNGNISFGADLPKGAYILKVVSGDETITETIIKD